MRTKAILLVALLAALMLTMSASTAASHSFTFRYHGGGADGGGNLIIECLATHEGVTYTIGGACRTPCPEGTCDIIVTDDNKGTNVRFRIQIDDEAFFRPGLYKHEAHVPGNYVRIGVGVSDASAGWITLS